MSTDPVEQRQNRIITIAAVVALLALMLGLFLYLQQGDDETPAAETTSSPTVESTPSEDTDTDEDAEDDERGDLPGQDEIEDASKASAPARKTATKVIEEMAKTDQSTKKWRSNVAPLFTKDGRAQVNSMTPKDVEFSKRTGPANLVLSDGGRSKTQFPIAVDTDKGMWMVLVVEDEDDEWRALSVSKYDDEAPRSTA